MQRCIGETPMATLGTLWHKGHTSHQMAPSLVPQIPLPCDVNDSVSFVLPWRVHVYMRGLTGSDLIPGTLLSN